MQSIITAMLLLIARIYGYFSNRTCDHLPPRQPRRTTHSQWHRAIRRDVRSGELPHPVRNTPSGARYYYWKGRSRCGRAIDEAPRTNARRSRRTEEPFARPTVTAAAVLPFAALVHRSDCPWERDELLSGPEWRRRRRRRRTRCRRRIGW